MLSQDEIDSLLSTLSVGSKDKPANAQQQADNKPAELSLENILHEERQKNYKLYNFRRPDKFSKDHLRALQSIHESFARQFSLVLSAYLRLGIEIEIVSVDQLTYDEFVRSMPRPATICILELAPLPCQVLFGMGFEVTMSIIDRMLGGPGVSETKPRELTDIEGSLIKRVVERATICMEEAWRSVMNVHVSMMGLEENYAMIQIASPGEIVALVTFEVTFANRDSSLMSLCIPYPVLEGVIDQLSSQHMFHRQQAAAQTEQQKILKKMHYASVPVTALMGGSQINLRDLLALREGDVLRTDRLAHEEFLLCVNNRPKFFCRPGTVKETIAVCISQPVESTEGLSGFGLDEHGFAETLPVEES